MAKWRPCELTLAGRKKKPVKLARDVR